METTDSFVSPVHDGLPRGVGSRRRPGRAAHRRARRRRGDESPAGGRVRREVRGDADAAARLAPSRAGELLAARGGDARRMGPSHGAHHAGLRRQLRAAREVPRRAVGAFRYEHRLRRAPLFRPLDSRAAGLALPDGREFGLRPASHPDALRRAVPRQVDRLGHQQGRHDDDALCGLFPR